MKILMAAVMMGIVSFSLQAQVKESCIVVEEEGSTEWSAEYNQQTKKTNFIYKVTNGADVFQPKLKKMSYKVRSHQIWTEEDLKDDRYLLGDSIKDIEAQDLTNIETFSAFIAEGRYKDVNVNIIKFVGKNSKVLKKLGMLFVNTVECP